MPMALNESMNNPFNKTLNDSLHDPLNYVLKHPLDDKSNRPRNGTFHASLNDPAIDPPNDPLRDQLQTPLIDPINDTFHDPLNEPGFNSSNDTVNAMSKDPLIDLSTDPTNDTFKVPLNCPISESIGGQLNIPLNNPANDSLKHSSYDPLNEPLSNSLALELYVELEDEEFFEDMALHETPILQQPPNTPTHSLPVAAHGTTHLAPRAEMEQDLDTDEFEDSVEQPTGIGSMDLHGALEDCEKAISFFFNNQLDNAIAIMAPWKDTSLYHAHGAAIFEFIPAVLTLEPTQVQRAQDALRQTFTLCGQLRKSYTFVQSIGAIIKKPNYGGYTEEEAHAELVHAESLLLLACLGIIENEDMTGFLRASLRIRTSYNGYRNCAKILARKSWENETSRAHFESGVRLGLATFNVMIALLPPRIVALLEFVGFSANKEKGKEELLKAADSPGLRSVLCELTLLVYYLIIGHFAAIPPDFQAAEKIISSSLKRYPDSIWFLMFKARTNLLQGRIVAAIETYQKTCLIKNLWPQLKHLAYWELVWAFAMLRRWTNAAEYAALLERDSKWSRTIYMYAQAAMLLENGHHSETERQCIDDLLTNASCYKQRLLGRSLPMEKFVVRRCERWTKHGCLVLPGIEWLYLWNIFPSLAAEQNHADLILRIIEQTKYKISNALNKKQSKAEGQDTSEYDQDDQALAEFLQGSLLAAMSLPYLAMQNLETVLAMKEQIQEHTYLLPYATVEIAFCHYQLGDPFRAIELLQEARKKYSGYLLESRLHFRIHSKLEFIRTGIEYSEIVKKAETITISGEDVIAARKAKMQPNASTDSSSDSNSASNGNSGSISKKNDLQGLNSNAKAGSSSSESATYASDTQYLEGPNTNSNTNVTRQPNVSNNADPGTKMANFNVTARGNSSTEPRVSFAPLDTDPNASTELSNIGDRCRT